MNPDDFKRAWQTQTSQTRLTIDAELLLREVRRNQQPPLLTRVAGGARDRPSDLEIVL